MNKTNRSISGVVSAALALAFSCSVMPVTVFADNAVEYGTVTITVIDEETNELFTEDRNCFSVNGGPVSSDGMSGGAVYLDGWNPSESNPHTITNAMTDFQYAILYTGKDYDGYTYYIDGEKSDTQFTAAKDSVTDLTIYMKKNYWGDNINTSDTNALKLTKEKAVDVTIAEGEQIQLDLGVAPELYDLNDIRFYSVNKKAYVSHSGKLIGCGAGKDQVVVYAYDTSTHTSKEFTLNVTVEKSDKISADDRAEIERLNGIETVDFCRRKMELLGAISEDAPRLTMDKLQEFIDSSENNLELVKKVMNYVDYPDMVYDGNSTSYDFWLDSNGNEVVSIGYEANYAAYTKIADNGTVIGGQMLYPEKTEFAENGKDISFEYIQYHDIIPEGKGSVTLTMIDETNGESFAETNGTFRLISKFTEKDGTVTEEVFKSWNISDGTTITIDEMPIDRSYELRYADEYHEDENGNMYRYEIDINKWTHVYSFITPREYKFNVYLEKHYLSDPVLLGDVNGDDLLNIADAVSLQKWLAGSSDIELPNLKYADLNYDNRLDVFDLIILKNKLIQEVQVQK